MSDNATMEPEKKSANEGSTDAANAFRQAAEAPKEGIVAEFADFLKNNKKWWLTPIIVICCSSAC